MFYNYQMDSKPSVAVVILNWNGRHYLEKYLPSVLASGYSNLKIVVADNNSSDDSVIFLEANYPDVHIVKLSENYGFSKGYNLALKQIDSDYFVLLNSDVAVSHDWIFPIVELMESDKNIAACQPKILSAINPDTFEYAGASGGWIDKYGYPFCRGRVFDTCETDEGQYNDIAEIFWASGAAMFVRADAYKNCGGLDESFFAHQEEIDLCWRLKNAGYKIMVNPRSVVYHLGGGSLEQGNKRKIYLNFRNNLLLMQKNLHENERGKKINSRHFLNFAASIQFVLKGQFSNAMAVYRATKDFLKQKNSVSKFEEGNHKLTEMAGVYNGSLVSEYFLKKKRKFSEIVHLKK